MISVFKYEIDPRNTEIELRKGAEVLSVGFQGHCFCMWVKIDTSEEAEVRNFVAFATGQEIPNEMGQDYNYIGTGHTDEGLVFHAFERLGL